MKKVLLIQLPIPQLNFGVKTGNIPLGAAYLKQAVAGIPDCCVDIVPESMASYAADQALIRYIVERRPDILGFTVFCWNLDRSLYIAECIKQEIQTRIIFGGPEITPDNTRIQSSVVDFYVYGEGETMFTSLLTSDAPWHQGCGSDGSGTCFLSQGSPYVNGYLAPGLENVMLLETQRGCPYRCGFCYYNKSKNKRSIAPDRIVLDSIFWAMDHQVAEIYLLDPSLNSRPGLPVLLEKIAGLNEKGQIALISEIRAESVDRVTAELYKNAGFKGFEVGLQSTNPAALKLMNRPTDLAAFLNGVKQLQAVGIAPTVDLIFGLPGDTLSGFKQTLEFVYDHHLYDHIQVFPLLVLPGTQFRKKQRELGLTYETNPPYTLISTKDFTPHDMRRALDSAEALFDVTLCVFPDLDVAFKNDTCQDGYVTLEGRQFVSKLIFYHQRPIEEIEPLSGLLTSPYQVFFGPGVTDQIYMKTVLRMLSENNPFVPAEIVFITPEHLPDIEQILSIMAIQRPHFLDHDRHYLYPKPGNRAVQFTVISRRTDLWFQADMGRQIFLWDRDNLPEEAELRALSHLDGIMIDSQLPADTVKKWQKRCFRLNDDILPVNFADMALQNHWMELTHHERYNVPVLKCRGIV
ncbi:MAG: radical SAM protein [Proteobacteria bacterium]|nr:radical SAM protein [Pseudomonadota bacterium]MBU1582871.1 radical SAM protein [Pseudomonadota bacterium]MBU2452786.1 radical SAM protein [Pseudomonadota bacterium]MBU2629488.1 radical SAM protein [Pseudomonadota bacterium]